MPDVQKEIDALYSQPLDVFIAARNEIAARLSAEGDREAAADVNRLRKPTVVAWAVNQLVHRRPDEMKALVELRERIGADTKAATAERRRLLSRLARRAEDILRAGGHRPTSDTTRRISTTLLAGSTGTEEEAFRAGRLTRELQPGSDSAFGSVEPESPDAAAPAGEEVAAREEMRERARRRGEEAAAAEREAHRLRREAEAAQAEAERAAKVAARAAKRASDAAESAASARRRADDAVEEMDPRV